MVVTALAISSQARVMYPTCAKGSGESRRSPGWLKTSVARATAARLTWSKIAPFGFPVVPLVQTTATGSSGWSSGHDVGGEPGQASRASALSTTGTVVCSGSDPPPWASTTTSVGETRSTMDATSAPPSRGLMPEVMAPRRSAAA